MVAMKAEDESVRIKLVEYMQKRVGETFNVMVTGFAQKKVFFETDEHIECSWDVTTAINYYVFNEEIYHHFIAFVPRNGLQKPLNRTDNPPRGDY